MIQIGEYKQDLEKIIHIINYSLKIDVAIFDIQSHLIACTQDYLRHKGDTVHAPSIEEVVANGNVMVNKPGHMTACAGCRFIGNCPAKIEILKSISTGTTPMGVMTFTSFSEKAHDRITRETQVFVEALNIFSTWIAELVSQKHSFTRLNQTEEILENFMDLSWESLLTIDAKGTVTRCNPCAQKFFSFCDLYTRTAFHILPEPVVDKVLEGSHFKDTRVMINNKPAFVSARPVFENDQFNGALLSIRVPENQGIECRPCENQETTDLDKAGPDKTEQGFSLSSILGQSPDIVGIKQTVTKLYHSSSTILITGQTGTGKGLLAKVIHHNSARAQGPFVPVNCASIPESLFESELFGYEEGAFTGAKKGGKPGRFELAQGGTLFLDEIGEMPLHMQVKLLNVLQDYSLQRVGGITVLPVDVRIIAATNQDLDILVKKKEFRADLFYRLNVIPMDLPPLAKRQQDIETLIQAFLKESNSKARKNIQKISEQVLELLLSHTWPGNIRELQNIIEYAINMEETKTITLASLPERFLKHHTDQFHGQTQGPGILPDIKSRVMTTEKETIISCLDRHGHDVRGKTLTSRELGISLRTLYRKLKQA